MYITVCADIVFMDDCCLSVSLLSVFFSFPKPHMDNAQKRLAVQCNMYIGVDCHQIFCKHCRVISQSHMLTDKGPHTVQNDPLQNPQKDEEFLLVSQMGFGRLLTQQNNIQACGSSANINISVNFTH